MQRGLDSFTDNWPEQLVEFLRGNAFSLKVLELLNCEHIVNVDGYLFELRELEVLRVRQSAVAAGAGLNIANLARPHGRSERTQHEKLKVLDVEGSAVSCVPEGIYAAMPALEFLGYRNNHVSRLPPEIKNSPNLVTIAIREVKKKKKI